MNVNDEEAIGFLNCLLERLHQAGFDQHCSHIEIVLVSPGAQHVDNQYNFSDKVPGKHPDTDRSGELPDILRTPEAMALWRKTQQAGYVDTHYQPLLSRTLAALLADAMAERLGIKEKWKVFEAFWHRKNMYKDLYDALNQKQSLVFQDNLKAILR